jgi:putative ABC transport system ATP-binding protein
MNPSPPTASALPVFEAVDLKREYDDGQVQALRGVSFRIEEGEFVSVTGPSGCGKTTLLQVLGSLETPTSGVIRFRGQSLTEMPNLAAYRAKEIGFVFQSFHLLPTFTSLENVEIPMFETISSPKERVERAKQLLVSVGLEHRMNHLPAKLSGGERQRVAIARSLANEPPVLLADEPTGNLDSVSAKLVLELLINLQNTRQFTMVLVTHDMGIAKRASRVLAMKDGCTVTPAPAETPSSV